MKWSIGTSGTPIFIVLLHRRHVSTYIQVIFRPSFTDKSIKCFLRWVIPVVLSKYEYVRNNIFVYSHKTQLCAIKYVYYIYCNNVFRPSTAIIRFYMKTSSICTIDHRSSVWVGRVWGYFARYRLGLGYADQ